MGKTINQSYSKRDNALFAKMSSRRLLRWYNNRLSKIDSQEKIWLIVFTRPDKYPDYQKEKHWWLKFWVWDSEKNEIVGENILCDYQFHHDSKTLMPSGSNVAECYMHREFEYVVFRDRKERAHMIYDFSGKIVAQTESNNTDQYKFVPEDMYYHSTFVNKDLFVSKIGDSLSVYHLNEKTNDVLPRKVPLWNGGEMRIDYEFRICFQGNYCVVLAKDKVSQVPLSDITTLFVYTKHHEKDAYTHAFKTCFDTGVTLHNVEVAENEECLIISFQCESIIHEIFPTTIFQLPKKILK